MSLPERSLADCCGRRGEQLSRRNGEDDRTLCNAVSGDAVGGSGRLFELFEVSFDVKMEGWLEFFIPGLMAYR